MDGEQCLLAPGAMPGCVVMSRGDAGGIAAKPMRSTAVAVVAAGS